MKKFTVLFCLIVSCLLCNGQVENSHYCGSDALHLAEMERNPSYRQKSETSNVLWQKKDTDFTPYYRRSGTSSLSTPANPIKLNVVFHDMTSLTNPGTSDYSLIVEQLTKIFRGQALSPLIKGGMLENDKTPSNDTSIEFCLATKDINGDLYPVDQSRHPSIVSSINIGIPANIADVVSESGSTARFPTARYINIYIVDDIAGSVAGFASMPSAHGTVTDGIFVERNFLSDFSTDGSNLNYNLNVLAHEMGHYLGLFHVFGICNPATIGGLTIAGYNPCSCDNGNCLFNGDMVCDTPPSMLPDIPRTNYNTCATDVTPGGQMGDGPDAWNNYMDYGDWLVQYNFSLGQRERMLFMIDPITGPRKSLLGPVSCEECDEMNLCQFSIASPISGNNNEVVYGSTANFTPNQSCSTTVEYSWTLTLLGTPNNDLGTVVSPTYTTSNTLGVGNYRLTMRATSTQSLNCFEEVVYNFSVIPVAGACNLVLPADNSSWGDFNRVSYEGGWTVPNGQFPPNWTWPGTNRYEPSHPSFDSAGFDIVSSTNGDPNFPVAQYANPPGVTSLIRIGRVITNSSNLLPGNAYYVSYKFNVSRDNCKFRIHSLGVREAPGPQNVRYVDFNVSYSPENPASFGYVCKYNFESPFVSTGQNPVTVGMGENGTFHEDSGGTYRRAKTYGLNDMVSEKHNSLSTDFTEIGTSDLRRMNAWKSQDLDFSEFVDRNTEITITFFAHSNSAENSLNSAYAYFGVECLGGGIPKDNNFVLSDVSIPCGFSGQSCVTYELPLPSYALTCLQNTGGANTTPAFLPFDAPFGQIKVYRIDGSNSTLINGAVSQTQVWVCPTPTIRVNLCLSSADVPFEDFRIEYLSLNQPIIQNVRVYAGFYHQTPPCAGQTGPSGGTHDPTIHDQNYEIWCPGTDLPTLHLTPPCFAGPYQYRWLLGGPTGPPIIGANGPTYTVPQHQISNVCSQVFVRQVRYIDPYCGTEQWFDSEMLTVYNQGVLNPSLTPTANDICLDGTSSTVIVNLRDIKLVSANCIPSSVMATAGSSIRFDLVYGGSVISSTPLIFDISNFNNSTSSVFPLSAFETLSFNNSTPGGGYLLSVGSHVIDLRITVFINDSTRNVICQNIINKPNFITVVVKNSALGGVIQVSDTNCSDSIVSINNTESGYTNPSIGYQWEVASSPSGPYSILDGSPNTSFLQDFNFSIVAASTFFIRRVSTENGQCASTDYSNIVQITTGGSNVPLFSFPTAICNSGIPPTLPTVSDNGIAGTWSPNIISTISAGTYTFTPLASQCATSTSVTTSIIPSQTPTFNLATSYCETTLPILPSSSNEGFTGTWTPASITATGNYNFQPNAEQCASPAIISIGVIPVITPTFSFATTYCAGSIAPALPMQSDNSIGGIWSPGSINTANVGTFPYTFTANVNGACSAVTINITIQPAPVPTFSFPTTICAGTSIPVLPLVSDNGINGTWSPSVISGSSSGVYTFASADLCVAPLSVLVTISTECAFYLSWGSDVGCEFANQIRKLDSNIEDGGCLRVCENSTITYTINGNSSLISNIDWNVTGGIDTPSNLSSLSVDVVWGEAAFASIQFTILFTDGSSKTYSLCVQKLEQPDALFGVLPNLTDISYDTCVDIPVHFENLSTSNEGNDMLYYNWDFGDGTSSNEFEPSHTYMQMGQYTVTLAAYNGCSCVDTHTFTVYVGKATLAIECVGVACEGDRVDYIVPFDQGTTSTRCDFEWTVTGGTIVNRSGNQVTVEWNQVGPDGFGQLNVRTELCDDCSAPTTIKIPVVTEIGTIEGRNRICQKSESIYSLPQWPSTEFDWEIEDNGTGAFLIATIQRNEIIVRSNAAGIVTLKCKYRNTLLRCEGSATMQIVVEPNAVLIGDRVVCENSTSAYFFRNEQGAVVSNPSWIVTGPNNYQTAGSSTNFDLTFPSDGIYIVEFNAPGYCDGNFTIDVKSQIAAPSAIVGPTLVCPGIPVTYTCAPMAGAITHWVVQNGTIAGGVDTGNEIQVNFNAVGPYSVQVFYEDERCSSAIYTVTVQPDVPNVNLLTGDTQVCGSTFKTYTVTNVNAESYIWSIIPPIAGSVENGQNTVAPTILWNQASGTATLQLEVKKCGISYFFPFVITIFDSPSLTVSVPSTICTGVSFPVNFILNPSGGSFSTVSVDYGDSTDTTLSFAQYLANPILLSHTYTDAISINTTRTITVTVRGASGCPAPSIATAPIVVSPMPLISLNPVVDLNLCSSENALNPASHTYAVNIQSGFGQTTAIEWFRLVGGQTVSLGSSPSFNSINVWNLGVVGTYWAEVTNEFGCKQETRRFNVYSNCLEASCSAVSSLQGVVTHTDCGKIQATISVSDPNATRSFWGNVNLNGATVTTNDNTNFEAENLSPGSYSLRLCGEYSNGGIPCVDCVPVPFVIPYRAKLKYDIECATGGMYKVTLVDHSEYYTPITLFEFTTNNGLSWIQELPVGGIAKHETYLPPGTYQVGIRISSPGSLPCIKYETLVLPAFPNASFTATTECQGTATRFTPAQTSGVEYLWTFLPDGSQNIQRNPVKTFATILGNVAVLTVTNPYGCSDTKTNGVSVTPVNMQGGAIAAPINACEGSPLTVTFASDNGFTIPVSFEWYRDQLTSNPIGTTFGTQGFTATASGSYFAYAIDNNGCKVTNTRPVTVMFVPRPDAPVIDGTAIVCAGGVANVFVPNDSSVQYSWTLDGSPKPEWNNRTRVTQQFLTVGTHTFSVTASTEAAGGVRCEGPASIYVVTVTEKPWVPEIAVDLTDCNPYTVRVFIANEQPGVDYYWSNGMTGVETEVSHGGPIRVRAVLGQCTEVSQTDLPYDLETLAWVFPKGCYEICKGELPGYLIGPFGSYQGFAWTVQGEQIVNGSGEVAPFAVDGVVSYDYGLFLQTPDCDKTIESMQMTIDSDCKLCSSNMSVKDVTKASTTDGLVCWYVIDLEFTNTSGVPISLTLSAPNGEGYFVPNTLFIPTGPSNAVVAFYPTNNFTGGAVDVFLNGVGERFDCFEMDSIELPELCLEPRPATGINWRSTLSELLLVAPNPAQSSTTIYYDFGAYEGARALEVYDYLGRKLFGTLPAEQTGKTEIDTERYADGSYFVFMKVDGKIVKKNKLVIRRH